MVTDASTELQIIGAQCGENGRWWLCPRAGDLATALAMCDGNTSVLSLAWCWGRVSRRDV